MPRSIEFQYHDPLDLIWLRVAADFGMTIVRSDEVFASWDGDSRLTLGTSATLDADDCLAQMVLHELCHAFVEGPAAWQEIDWGLRMDVAAQRVHELACMRLQAAITAPFGLRPMLAPTTNLRWYYDSLPDDPLAADPDDEEAIRLAKFGYEAAHQDKRLLQGLQLTSDLAKTIGSIAPADSLWSQPTSAR